MSDKKKKKPKTVYYDDGRTIADMSYLGTKRPREPQGVKKSGWREKWRTYFQSVKMMLLPTLIVLGLVTVTFGLLYLLLSMAS